MKKHYFFIVLFLFSLSEINAQASYLKTINSTTATNLNTGTGIEFNGFRYFFASKNFTESTVWRTDGTELNTIDFIDSDDVSSAQPIFVFNNELYYNTFELGQFKIYKTDGITKTPFFTQNSEITFASLNIEAVASINNNFVYALNSNTIGTEIYVSDGTPNNLVLLKDINSGSASSQPNYFTKIDTDKVVFIANDGTNGRELWVTDGTTNGTQLVKDITANGNSFIDKLTSFNGKAYFRLGNDIWESDGTEAGTNIFLNLRSDDTSDEPFYEYNNELYFTAFDATFTAIDLWKTDGTVTGTVLLKSGFEFADVFQRTNNLLFFAANTQANGYELWRTDGTAAGTFLTRDINVGPEDSLVSDPSLGNGGDKLFFEAIFYDDDEAVENALDGELWSSDGTEMGTLLNTTINPGSGEGQPDNFFNINDKLIFKANTSSMQGIDLWIVDANLLSVTDTDYENEILQLYPNPVSNTLFIKNSSVSKIDTVRLFSADGKQIKTITNANSGISVQDLNTGIYILNVEFEHGIQKSLKFIKD